MIEVVRNYLNGLFGDEVIEGVDDIPIAVYPMLKEITFAMKACEIECKK